MTTAAPSEAKLTSTMRSRSRVKGVKPAVPAVFTLPVMLVITIFYIAPIIASFVLSLTNWTAYTPVIRFTGLSNLNDLRVDDRFWAGLGATLKFAVFFTIVVNLLALALALSLEKTNRLSGIFRTVIFIPVLVSPLAAGYMFKGLLDPNGPFNDVLSVISGRPVTIEWLGNVHWSIYLVSLIQVWKSVGIFMLVYIAGLNSVPETLINAAQVDGASRWQVLRHVKLPMLGPSFTFNIALSIIAGMQTFEVIISTTQGGPGNATGVLNFLTWQTYSSGTYGYAAALNLSLFLLIFLIAIPAIVVLRRREVEG